MMQSVEMKRHESKHNNMMETELEKKQKNKYRKHK